MKKFFTTKVLCRAAIVAALYVALTFACLSVASGNIQFRVSEMLTVLPLFYAEAIPALFVGCVVSNLISGCVLWDVVLGSLVTLVAAGLTYLTGRIFKNGIVRVVVGGLFPVSLNAFFLPLIWWLAYGEMSVGYVLNVGYLFLSEGVIVWLFGAVLYAALRRLIYVRKVSVLQPLFSTSD